MRFVTSSTAVGDDRARSRRCAERCGALLRRYSRSSADGGRRNTSLRRNPLRNATSMK